MSHGSRRHAVGRVAARRAAARQRHRVAGCGAARKPRGVRAGGLPDTRVEAWKYTALRALAQRRFANGDDGCARAWSMRRVSSCLVSTVRGWSSSTACFAPICRCSIACPPGSRCSRCRRHCKANAEPLRFACRDITARPAMRSRAINAANANDGVVLRVAANARIDTPVHLVFVGAAGEADLAWHARNVIELGEGAAADPDRASRGQWRSEPSGHVGQRHRIARRCALRHTVLQNAAIGAA
jgi:Fe-S cluster assembly protein SufD